MHAWRTQETIYLPVDPQRERAVLRRREETHGEGDNTDFLPRRQPPRERGPSSFPRGATKRETESSFLLRPTERHDSVSSTRHREMDYRSFAEEPRRERRSPSRRQRWRGFEREKCEPKRTERNTRSSSLSSHVANTWPQIRSLLILKLKTPLMFINLFDLFLMPN